MTAPDDAPIPGVDRCRGGEDGDCFWNHCPQHRDSEPMATGRHCPLDVIPREADG